MGFKEEIVLASKADTRGFKKTESAAAKLTKQIKSLGAVIGVSLSSAAVINFGKASVKAFTEAEKSNTQLANSVKNLGLSFAQSNITNFLDKISASSGIAGETLNQAFQSLITTTGSLTKSQDLLNLALDVSAGSTYDLVTVSNDLASAYVGKTRGLDKYKLGLTQAQLKVASFTDLQERLNKQFSGSNEKYLNTYAGKMQILAEAAGNAQEIIGGGLLDALGMLAGGGVDDIDKASKAMAGLATETSNVIRGQARVLQNLSNLGGGTGGKLAGYIKGYFKEVLGIQALEDLGKSTLPATRANRRFMGGAQANLYSASEAAEKKFRADQKKFQDAQVKATKALTAEQKKQAALKKAGAIFDLEQIQIIAALKGKISEEDRKRLELQFALLVGNEDEAKRLTYQLAIAQGLGVDIAKHLASLPQAANPFASWEAYLDMIAEKARKIASITVNAPLGTAAAAAASGTTVSTNVSTNVPVTGFTPPPSGTYGTPTGVVQGPQVIELKITGDGDLTNTIAKNLMNQSLSSGNQAYINRRTGGFE